MPKSNANLALKGLDEMFSTEESRQEQKREQVQQIPIEELFPFKEHPFKVLDDEAMQRTVESVAQYAALPRMVMMTYKIPESIQQIAKQGEYDEFDLNVFFSAKGKGRDCRFVYEDYVQKWLDLMRCSYLETTVDELKLGAKKPALPFADSRLLNVLQHTLWFLPNVASCYAMANLLADRKNTFYHDYRINVCAGTEAGIGAAALEPVQRSMGDPLADQDHYPFLWQADHRRDGEAVDRHLYAAEPLQPGDLFSGCIPCAKPLGSDHGQGAKGDHQERVLCVRLCAQPCSAADLRL